MRKQIGLVWESGRVYTWIGLAAAMLLAGLTAACGFAGGGVGGGGGGGGGGGNAACQTVPAGQARATKISSQSQALLGRSAESKVGDYKLQNSKVAVVIKNSASSTVFLPFGGYPVDVVPTDAEGCPLPQDSFGEMGTLVGNLDFSDLNNVSLRGFAPETIQVLKDGSDGGNAVVRVTGTDIPIPIIETGLLLIVPGKEFSTPMGLDLQNDYVLAPDSNTLEIQTTVTNPLGGDSINIGLADGFLFGDGMSTNYPNATYGNIAGYTVFVDIKFLTSSNGAISYGYGLNGDHLMTSVDIQNVTPALDQTLIDTPIHLLPGQSGLFSRRLVIVAGGANAVAQEFYPMWGFSVEPFFGMVVTQGTGEPVEGANVEVRTNDADQTYITTFTTDADGFFIGVLPAGTYNAFVSKANRSGAGPIALPRPFNYGMTFTVGAPGRVTYDIRDQTGKNIPAKLTFYQGLWPANYIFTANGQGTQDFPPGTYDVSISRGPEYTVSWWRQLVVTAGGEAEVRATLERVVDTAGFVAAEFHIHCEPSPDSDFPLAQRIASLVDEGVEFVCSTDHEVVTNYWPYIRSLGVADKIYAVEGEEISSPVLGHFNGIGMTWDPRMRGNGAIDWFLLSPQQVFDLAREHGADIVQCNHPLDTDDGYLNQIKFNPLTGLAEETDPMILGLLPGTDFVTFDFDSIEIFNGGTKDQVFYDPGNPEESGIVRHWFTLLNLGHRITGSGTSDSHRPSRPPGFGRNIIESSTDDPAKINPQELLDNFKAMRSVVSGGAFIRFTVDNTGLGRTVTDTDGMVDLKIQVQSPDWVDVTKIAIFQNCNLIQTIDVTDQSPIIKYEGQLSVPVAVDSWFVVFAAGQNSLYPVAPDLDWQAPRAITNPIYVDRDGNGHFDAPGIIPCNWDGSPF